MEEVSNCTTLPEITFGSLWKQTWEKMRENWGKLILAGLIQILIVSGANFIPVLCFVSGLLLVFSNLFL